MTVKAIQASAVYTIDYRPAKGWDLARLVVIDDANGVEVAVLRGRDAEVICEIIQAMNGGSSFVAVPVYDEKQPDPFDGFKA